MSTSVPELRLRSPAGRWVLAATVLGSGLSFLDATVVNIALPAIGRDLDAATTGLTWTVNAYAVTLAALVLVGGTLGDRYGRRRVFLVGVAWFGLASLACALAPGIGTLVTARALQGVGAALVTPGALAILQTSFAPADRSRAIGAWSGLAGIAGAVGPFVGGWLVDLGSWRWVFLVNVPIAVAVLVITLRHLHEPALTPRTEPLDVPGAVLVAVALGGLSHGLTAWPGTGASAGLAVGGAALLGFLARERTARAPMLPLGVFADRTFTVTNVVTFLVYAALGGVFLWLVVTLQVVAGWGALAAGLALLPVTVLMLVLSAYAGTLGDRLGPRLPMAVGTATAAVGVALLTRVSSGSVGAFEVLGPVTLLALGLTATVAPLTATVLAAVPEEQAGLASGINNAVARSGGLLLVAALPAVTGLGPRGFAEAESLAPAFRTAMLVCAGLLALGAVLAGAFVRRPRPSPAAETCPAVHCAVGAPPPGVAPEERVG